MREETPLEIIKSYVECNFSQEDPESIEQWLRDMDEEENNGEPMWINDFSEDDYFEFHDRDGDHTLILMFLIAVVKENFDYGFFENIYKDHFKDYQPDKSYGLEIGLFIEEFKNILKTKEDGITIGGSKLPGDKKLIKKVLEYCDREFGYYNPCKEYEVTSYKLKKVYDAYTPEIFSQVMGCIQNKDCWGHDSTPNDISELSQRILETGEGTKILDLCSGRGTFLLKYIKDYNNPEYSFDGVDLDSTDSLMLAIKLRMGNIKSKIEAANIFSFNFTKEYDKIFCEPMFGAELTSATKNSIIKNSPFEYPIVTSSEWFYIMVGINNLSKNGRMIAIVPNGILQNTRDVEIRMQLLNEGYVESVIQLPKDTLHGTKIMSSVIVFSHNNKKAKFLDAHSLIKKEESTNKKQSKNNTLDVDKVINILGGSAIKNVFKIVDEDKVLKSYFTLLPERYTNASSTRRMPNPKKIEDITEKIYRGVQFAYKDYDIYKLEPGEKHIVELVSASNIECGKITGAFRKIKDNPERFNKFYLEDNDIIVSARGESIKVGVFENKHNKLFAPMDGIIVIRLKEKQDAFYVCAFLESSVGKKMLSELQTGSTSKLLSVSSVKKLIIPFPNNPIHKRMIGSEFQDNTNSLCIIKKQIKQVEEKIANRFNGLCEVEG